MSDQQQSSKPSVSTDALSQKRRALIKGSAVAIPAILTLRSGSALAAESISCALKTRQNPPGAGQGPSPVTSADDSWFRQSTDYRQLTSISPTPGATVNVFRDPTNPSNWYNENSNNSNTASAFVDGLTNQMTSNGVTYSYSGTSTRYVLVQVDANGNRTGVIGAAANGDFPFAYDSCYGSLHPGG